VVGCPFGQARSQLRLSGDVERESAVQSANRGERFDDVGQSSLTPADRFFASLGNYLLLVEYTGRLFRNGKAVISAELSGILERIGSSAESWCARLEKLRKGHLLGRFFAASRARLRQVAATWAFTTWPTSPDALPDKQRLPGTRCRPHCPPSAPRSHSRPSIAIFFQMREGAVRHSSS
jgi:hypothetical protein